ncbi:hypothetical protein DE146DRAFT_764549 [Phaeosphaeria sp. MPI-PUGE-AT-0046c]|nr:hypothetical protein DE146DRAFT_764549 [Phaeosphaeria sp. MPI-PUGE-AT-0046c]
MTPPTSSSLHDLATSFLAAFTNLSSANHLSLRAPECTHRYASLINHIFAPSTVQVNPKSNSDFATHMDANIRPLLIAFPVTAKEIHINEPKRQITIWATGKPKFKADAMDGDENEWDYTGEYIFILDVNEEGRIERILEFLDSLATERLRGLMVRARKNVGKSGAAW